MSEEMKKNALKTENFVSRKELTEDELKKVAGGATQFSDSGGYHFCGVLSDSAAFELCYIGRRECMQYSNNGDDVRTAPSRCSTCLFYYASFQ